jgi:hypothetical protein
MMGRVAIDLSMRSNSPSPRATRGLMAREKPSVATWRSPGASTSTELTAKGVVHCLVDKRARRLRATLRRLNVLALALEDAAQQDEKHGDVEDGEDRSGQHAADHRGADFDAALSPCAR